MQRTRESEKVREKREGDRRVKIAFEKSKKPSLSVEANKGERERGSAKERIHRKKESKGDGLRKRKRGR